MENVIVNLQVFLGGDMGMGMLQDRINELDSANSKFALKEISYD